MTEAERNIARQVTGNITLAELMDELEGEDYILTDDTERDGERFID